MATTDVVSSSIQDEKETNESGDGIKSDENQIKQEPSTEQLDNSNAANDGVTTTAAENNGTASNDMLVKHPLQLKWVLWYCKQDRTKNWEECLKQVATFETVEDFWALYNHIQLASGLSWGSDYYLFKEGIRPMCEDDGNVNGGRWLIQVDKTRRNDILDHFWLELLMAVVGEQFDDLGEYVCGAVVNIRQKGDKISLWTSDATKEDVNRRIGVIAKQKLGFSETISYEAHKDTSHKNSSMVKSLLRV